MKRNFIIFICVAVASHWGQAATQTSEDLNNDGRVTILNLSLLAVNWSN